METIILKYPAETYTLGSITENRYWHRECAELWKPGVEFGIALYSDQYRHRYDYEIRRKTSTAHTTTGFVYHYKSEFYSVATVVIKNNYRKNQTVVILRCNSLDNATENSALIIDNVHIVPYIYKKNKKLSI